MVKAWPDSPRLVSEAGPAPMFAHVKSGFESVAGRRRADVDEGRHGSVVGPVELEDLELGERRKRQQQGKQEGAVRSSA